MKRRIVERQKKNDGKKNRMTKRRMMERRMVKRQKKNDGKKIRMTKRRMMKRKKKDKKDGKRMDR